MLIVPFIFAKGTDMEKYLLNFDEINSLVTEVYNALSEADIEEKKREIEDIIEDLLIYAYTLGNEEIGNMLFYKSEIDTEKLNASVNKQIEDKTYKDRIRDHVDAGDLPRLITLVESEFHRVFEDSKGDGALAYMEATGIEPFKTWNEMEDDLVRDTHIYLGGVKIRLTQEFYTYDGDHALRPGSFKKVSNNANCRCWITYSIT